MDLPPHLIIRLGVALGVGLLIGIERERNKGQGPDREIAGVRTLALVALAGAVSLLAGDITVFAIFGALLGVLIAVGYRRRRTSDPGITTEVAILLTFLLGGLAMREPELAAAIAVIVTIILAARTRIHQWVHQVLTDDEVRDGLLLAAAALVILPLTPVEPVDPWNTIPLRKLWTLAVTVMAINGLGYIALRSCGAKVGLAIAGLFSGFASSTATIGAMGARAKEQPGLMPGAVAGAAFSSVATIAQLAIVVGLVSLEILRLLALPLLASGIAAIIYAGIFTLRSARAKTQGEISPGRPFDPKTALVFVLIVGVTLAISTALTRFLGNNGLLIATSVAGLADAHASAISAATQGANGRVAPTLAAIAILIGFTTNTVSKTVVAFTIGERHFALQLLPGLALMVAAAWGGWFLSEAVASRP